MFFFTQSQHSGAFMAIETIYTDQAPAPIGPYSQGKKVGGFIFTAGQIGLDGQGRIVDGGVAAQARQAIENLRAILEAGGSGLEDVVKTLIFLADMEDFAAVNAVYGEYFGVSVPARSTVQAARLPKDALVEIEAIAYVE
jgi:2-iminobutanoate/2-iminopropanoate deaminase